MGRMSLWIFCLVMGVSSTNSSQLLPQPSPKGHVSLPRSFLSGRGDINQGRGWGGSGNWKLGRLGTLGSTGGQNCRAVKGGVRAGARFCKGVWKRGKDRLLGLRERLLSWGRDQGLCMENVEVPVVGRGYHTWSRQILAVRTAASPPLPPHRHSPISLLGRLNPSSLSPPPCPASPAFLFEQVAFENFKHTLLFPRSAAQQFRLCS